ncbi:hypothetical protein PAECIP111893_00212 [Paenibacillus plantiphilus]|uniref:Uncharacterized protein n=1 Tax=Paenibacillus plantiphilus TaxID=2905650 RepID=A0ABN8FQ71_9BACL|nr:hypothetical protein [Paenibacillus plantiphilus]CAH1190174.1 hypothetical protein PAECIP111893_00212 [Paenibacillus plantiphilus]
MNISSASSSDFSIGASTGSIEASSGAEGSISQIEAKIRQLEKRKIVVLKQVAEVVTGKDTEEIKKKRVEVLRMEITGLDLQIQMLRAKIMELVRKQAEEKGQHVNHARRDNDSRAIDILI